MGWDAVVNHLSAMVHFLDAHQGSCMVLLTAALAFCAFVSCWISSRTVRLMKKLDEKRSSPYIVIETTQSIPFYGVRLMNKGLTAARNIQVESTPQICFTFPNFTKSIRFLSDGVDVLIPGGSYETAIGSWDTLKMANPALKYQCVIGYESDWGDKFSSRFVLDYSHYEGLANSGKNPINDLVRKFDTFARDFHHFATGFHKPHVLTEDFDKYNAQIIEGMEKHDMGQTETSLSNCQSDLTENSAKAGLVLQEKGNLTMPLLLDPTLCDSLYCLLNDTNVFQYDEKLKAKHSQVCAVLDRLRHATYWINTHQETPKGVNAPTLLMEFMMFASLIKTSIEELRDAFGLCDKLFNKNHPESRKFFASVCTGEPLNIPSNECPIDDAFFQYFRSLVFAHSGMIRHPLGILLPEEIQHCPYIVEHDLSDDDNDSDDYIGVMVYSNVKDRDGKLLRIRFSTLKEYLKSRYESLGLVIKTIKKKVDNSTRVWKKVKVDENQSPLEQLRFMRDEFKGRCEDCLVYETQRFIAVLESPCSLEDNRSLVDKYKREICSFLPQLVSSFERLDYSMYVQIINHFTDNQIDKSRKINYTLQKIFEYISNPYKHDWAMRDVEMVANDFVGKWVKIDTRVMSDEEVKMLIMLACYYEYGQYQPIDKETNHYCASEQEQSHEIR